MRLWLILESNFFLYTNVIRLSMISFFKVKDTFPTKKFSPKCNLETFRGFLILFSLQLIIHNIIYHNSEPYHLDM